MFLHLQLDPFKTILIDIVKEKGEEIFFLEKLTKHILALMSTPGHAATLFIYKIMLIGQKRNSMPEMVVSNGNREGHIHWHPYWISRTTTL